MANDNTANGSASDSPDSTSTSLLHRAKLHQADAWERLTQLYTPLLYRWCRGANLRPADAADVVQEVLSTVYARLADFDHDQPGASFRGWLRVITRHKIGDHFRRLRGEPQARGGTDAHRALHELPATDDPPSADDLASEGNLLLRGVLELVQAEFEPRTWRAFWLITVEDRPPDCAAKELGMTLAAVYKAKSRILNRLRQELDDRTT